jgi:ABC-type uncharacterized transport system substrate-binding protein
MIEGLMALGWIEPVNLPAWDNPEDTESVWRWLATEIKSDYLVFVADAYWSAAWDTELREKNQDACLDRLRRGELDLILALGTWAGLDLANDSHGVPTIVMSTTNPIEAGIIKSAEASGFPHVHAKCDPEEQIREIRTFHDIIDFERVGVVYDYDAEDSKIYAALPELQAVAVEKDFEVVTCHAPEFDIPEEQIRAGVRHCLERLAPQIDAFYVTAHEGLTPDALPDILTPLYEHEVTMWSQEGLGLVERGVLMSVARRDTDAVGRFEAETIAKVLNGARPGDLPQVYKEPKRLAINLAVAELIGYEVPSGLVTSADQVFTEIEGLK